MQRFVTFALATGLAAAAIGCGPPPSLRARWKVVDRDGEVHETTAAQVCSELGINTVRVRVFDELGDVADDEYHACFAHRFDDPERTVAGPALPAGSYTVEVRGVQRDLEPWDDLAFTQTQLGCAENQDGDVRCDGKQCECRSFEARDDHTERLEDFVIVAPGECFDGIDNLEGDGKPDGLIDAEDPSCGTAPDALATEGRPVTKVQFRVLMTLFGGNTAVNCTGVGLTDMRARLCPRASGDPLAPCSEAEAIESVLACRTQTNLFFEQTLEQGDYTLELVVRDAQGTLRTTPQLFPVSFGGGGGAVVPIELDFPASSFDPPIEASAGFALDFEDGACAIGATSNQIAIAGVDVEILDAHGGALAQPVTLIDGTPLDGSTIPCPTGTLLSEPLEWGGYALRVSARTADGTVCFSTDGTGADGADAPLLLAPTSLQYTVPPVLDANGEPPEGC